MEANAKEAANGPTTLLHTPPPRVPLHLTKPEEMLVMQAEQSVEAEAGKRLASIGTDRTRWPAAARDEVMRLKKKQQVDMPCPLPPQTFFLAALHLSPPLPARLCVMASASVAAAAAAVIVVQFHILERVMQSQNLLAHAVSWLIQVITISLLLLLLLLCLLLLCPCSFECLDISLTGVG